MISSLNNRLSRTWAFIRALAGDDAYDRYRAHHATCSSSRPLLDRKAFYLERQRQKWGGVNRCC